MQRTIRDPFPNFKNVNKDLIQAGFSNRDFTEKAKDCIQPETNVYFYLKGNRNSYPYQKIQKFLQRAAWSENSSLRHSGRQKKT